MDNTYLTHYGIQGQRWGVRRYQNKDGSLTPAGVKKYAKAGYSEDSYKSNKTKLGKAYDKVTGAHKLGGEMMYNMSSDKENLRRANKYIADKEKAKSNKPTKKTSEKVHEDSKKLAENKKDAHEFNRLKNANAYNATKHAKRAAISAIASMSTVYAGSAAVKALSNRGYDQAASTVIKYSKTTVKVLTRYSQVETGAAVINAMMASPGSFQRYYKEEHRIKNMK